MADEINKTESQVPSGELKEGDLEIAAGGDHDIPADSAFIGKSNYAVVGNSSDSPPAEEEKRETEWQTGDFDGNT